MTTTFTFDLTPEGTTWVSCCRELGLTSAARNQPAAIKACVSAIAMAVDYEMRRSGAGSDAALEAIALRCRTAIGIGAAAGESPSVWRASPPAADEVRGGLVHWWIHPPGNAPYPVELCTRGAIVSLKSGLSIGHWQPEGTRWAPCVPPAP